MVAHGHARLWLVWSLIGLSLVVIPARSEPLEGSTLLYVSDYFSFVGSDDRGHVAFALDNNRGRDGGAYQAEHFAVLHDEHSGWIDVAGSGPYPNQDHAVDRIPDSDDFQFDGTPTTGLTITSHRNHLILVVEPLPARTRHRHDGALTWMGSAPATLTWQGRTIVGRVIYEYLLIPGFNRLTRTYWGLWNNFQGLYLLANGDGDVYVHSQESELLAPIVGKLTGFSALDGQTKELQDLRLRVVDRDFALGLFRWPTSWEISWMGAQGRSTLTLSASERKSIAGWVFGGFAMSIVRGELSQGGRVFSVYGLAELLM